MSIILEWTYHYSILVLHAMSRLNMKVSGSHTFLIVSIVSYRPPTYWRICVLLSLCFICFSNIRCVSFSILFVLFNYFCSVSFAFPMCVFFNTAYVIWLFLQQFVVYLVKIEAINRARLSNSARTSPIVFDESMPTPGHVTEGSEFTNDIVWWGYTDHITGTLCTQYTRCDETTCTTISMNTCSCNFYQ